MYELKRPPLWLLVLIVGLPQLSETIYTPALPDVARTLGVNHYLVENTLTVYLFGFAIGTLFWGKISDKYGRKPCLLAGLFIYIMGCIGCFYAITFNKFIINRFIQAFGGSTGSVLGQVICRVAFRGSDRGKVFSIISSALAFSPEIGPVIGGFIAQSWQWRTIFALLSVLGLCIVFLAGIKLPETRTSSGFSLQAVLVTAYSLIRDPKVLVARFLVAACNGIIFSYFAEGPFYLITSLRITPFYYGGSFIFFALAGMLGGYASKKAHDYNISSYDIMQKGIAIVIFGAIIFAIGTIFFYSLSMHAIYEIMFTIVSMMIIMTGIGMIIPNLLSSALDEYGANLGIASSLFGFYYYCLISYSL